ncbi:hypothetical protein DF19_40885 [Streptomyces olindensis]|nr:hypothetical protein DF19_40885 [Streptomyces olindensis]
MKRRTFTAMLGGLFVPAASMELIQPAFAATDFPANPTTKPGYSRDFGEEFDGTFLGSGTWLPYYLPHWTTRNLAAAHYSVSNSVLSLRLDQNMTAWCPTYDGTVRCSSITSYERNYFHQFKGYNGSMQLNHSEPLFDGYSTQYGYFEMRAKGPNCGGGGHAAWWMVGDHADQNADGTGGTRTGEIDITENLFSDLNSWVPKIFKWSDPKLSNMRTNISVSGDPASEFHVYGMEWTPGGLEFFYDNQYVGRLDGSPSYPMGMLLGLYTDTSWSGAANSTWPKTWHIDYIRVHKPNGSYIAYRLKNRNTGQYMHIENKTGKVQLSTSIPSDYWSSHWFVNTDNYGYTRFRNKWTGDALNNQTPSGAVQYSHVLDTWWSADWVLETHGDYKRIRNRNTGDYLHNENNLGYVQEGSAPTTWWSADWTLETVS